MALCWTPAAPGSRMTAINGNSAIGAPQPPDPRSIIAAAVYTLMMDEGDAPFSELDDEDRADLISLAEQYISAHVAFLTQQGFRLLPPGVTPIPTCAEEALAMVQAAKRFTDSARNGKGRKSALVGSVVPKGLILPPGMKH